MKYTKTVRASKNVRSATRRPVRASRTAMRRRSIKADEEFEDIPEDFDAPADVDVAEVADVTVDDAATELLFEAEDVAELVSEISGQPVDVTVDDEIVTFTVGDDEYTVTPDGDEEIVEESKRIRRSAKSVRAGRRIPARRVPASARVAASRRVPATRKVAASRRVSATRRPRK